MLHRRRKKVMSSRYPTRGTSALELSARTKVVSERNKFSQGLEAGDLAMQRAEEAVHVQPQVLELRQ